MLGEVAGEAHEVAEHAGQTDQHGTSWVETHLGEPLVRQRLAVPPVQGLRQLVDLLGRQPERLARVAHRAAGPVSDDRSRERGPVPAVLAVHVLDHLFPPLVLEIDVDVGRLVALARDEALEQHLRARGVDLGDPEAEADRGVGRRAPALAQDPPAPGEADDVVHREEIGLVGEVGDEGKLVLHELPHPSGRAVRPPGVHPLLRQSAQVTRRCLARRHQLLRVLVAQAVEGKVATPGHGNGFGQERGRVDAFEHLPRAQVPLPVGVQGVSRLGQRHPQTDGRERVLQFPASPLVHVHVARGDHRQTGRPGEGLAVSEPLVVVGTPGELDRKPGPAGKTPGHPPGLGHGRARAGKQQREAAREPPGEVRPLQSVASLHGLAPA